MKKLAALLLCALTLLLPLSACGSKPSGPLRVCLDLGLDEIDSNKAESAFKSLMKAVASMGGPEEYELELVPPEGEERDNGRQRAGPYYDLLRLKGGPAVPVP